MKNLIYYSLICMLALACNSNQPSETKESLLESSKVLSGKIFTLKVLPPATTQKGSTRKSIGLLLIIAPDPNAGPEKDVLRSSIHSEQEFKSANFELNFEMQNRFHLKNEIGEWQAVICEYENTYELVKFKQLYLEFADDHQLKSILADSEFTVWFDDPIFGAGLIPFHFETKSIKELYNL